MDNLDPERHTRPDVYGAVVEGVPVSPSKVKFASSMSVSNQYS